MTDFSTWDLFQLKARVRDIDQHLGKLKNKQNSTRHAATIAGIERDRQVAIADKNEALHEIQKRHHLRRAEPHETVELTGQLASWILVDMLLCGEITEDQLSAKAADAVRRAKLVQGAVWAEISRQKNISMGEPA